MWVWRTSVTFMSAYFFFKRKAIWGFFDASKGERRNEFFSDVFRFFIQIGLASIQWEYTRRRNLLIVTKLFVNGSQCAITDFKISWIRRLFSLSLCLCVNQLLWLIHTALGRDRETMGFYIVLCPVHTTQGQGTIVFYSTRPGPVQCIWAICPIPHEKPSKEEFNMILGRITPNYEISCSWK